MQGSEDERKERLAVKKRANERASKNILVFPKPPPGLAEFFRSAFATILEPGTDYLLRA